MGFERFPSRLGALFLFCWLVAVPARLAFAEPSVASADALPDLGKAPSLDGLIGEKLARIDVIVLGSRWVKPVTLRRVQVGVPFSGDQARLALTELLDSGRYADARADAVREGAGVVLRLFVTPRRIITGVKVTGGNLSDDDVLRAGGVDVNDSVTAQSLARSAERVRALYLARGFPHATVDAEPIDTDDEMRVTVTYHVSSGAPRIIGKASFVVYPPPTEHMREILDGYAVSEGDRADDEALTQADRDTQDALRKAGWHAAEIHHRLDGADVAKLTIDVQAGPDVVMRFEGNHRFDDAELTDALELDESDDRAPVTLASKLEKYYVERGYLDARVRPELRGGPNDPENVLVFRVNENEIVRVVSREYPCLNGGRLAGEVGQEIDSFLSEALPGTSIVGTVDPATIDSALDPQNQTGARVVPVEVNPWRTYVPDVYEKATRHLQELYRSEGYLSAVVGPVDLIRRVCDRHSPAGKCIPVGPRIRPETHCPVNDSDVPTEDQPPPPACIPDSRHGIRCEADLVVQIPIKLGPRARLWDVSFEGNQILLENQLFEVGELPLGEPVSQVELEKARRRLLDEYAERGFAFATIEQRIELSPDRTRARVRFIISERGQVRVKDIVVRGARRTNESLILSRVAFDEGDVYKRSDVRSTEERLATLGVFSSVTVGLEDPEVFATEKVVVITVRERAPQYLDLRPGFSTGDGFRVMLEYGHRNLGDQAIKLTLRVQLGLLPDFLIFERDVRARFQALPLQERLERRDTVSVEFPEVGLGPLFPLGIDLVDVRDNSRDFGLTKEATIGTLSYRPTTRFVTQIGGSLELNDARIFESGVDIAQYIATNPNASVRLRVPDGKTYAIAERTSVTWDRRDNPFDATRGTFVSASVEHVHAAPTDSSATITSDFLRLTSRVAGYVRLNDAGLALALSFRWGYNVQLNPQSQTYPDRLFYFGGVDSIRGFLQDSVIPEDLAERIIAGQKIAGQPGVDPKTILTAAEVPIRGGNVLLNPRAELRIPLGGVFQTALFVDSGNLWLLPSTVQPYKLRYAAGTGLRANTPVGPLALDIGMNLDRRQWEDPFAFHFSIGLF
ncbi:MAG TPA: POTRA domain-containing protein [Polyangiaceae bacterium]|jgi:outer membrane protein assembly factor BamA|nr:POTRA domain-containing protein [Polyangiaceae bacterium]